MPSYELVNKGFGWCISQSSLKNRTHRMSVCVCVCVCVCVYQYIKKLDKELVGMIMDAEKFQVPQGESQTGDLGETMAQPQGSG